MLLCYAGGQDFSPTIIPNIVFQDETELCTVFTLEDDSIYEPQSETFTVEITTEDTAVTMATNLAIVSIIDDDGKYFSVTVMCLWSILVLLMHCIHHRCCSQVCNQYILCQ